MKTDYQKLADYFLSVGQQYDTGEDHEDGVLWLCVHKNIYEFTLEGKYVSVETA